VGVGRARNGLAPLDAAMELPDEKYSYEVRRIVAEESSRARDQRVMPEVHAVEVADRDGGTYPRGSMAVAFTTCIRRRYRKDCWMTYVRLTITAVVFLACQDSRTTKDDKPAAPWQRIEELARPEGQPKAHEELTRAIEEQSVDALIAWHSRDGGLAPLAAKPRDGVLATKAMLDVGRLAIATQSGFVAGVHLGNRMVTQGRTLLEVMMGISLLRDAKLKGPVPLVPAPTELARIAAAEALFSRSMAEYAKTPEGQQDIPAMPPGTDWGALEKFWFAALDGGKRGEAPETTIARLKAAFAKIEGTPVHPAAASIVNVLERTAVDLKDLQPQ
jgi:hypothetical protein